MSNDQTMQVLSGHGADQILGVTPELLLSLQQMGAQGRSAHDMIWFLARNGVSKPGVLSALRRSRVMPSSETKEAVHLHPAFAARRESDEHFEQSVLAACGVTDVQDQTASAA